jgi:hypothetical protein
MTASEARSGYRLATSSNEAERAGEFGSNARQHPGSNFTTASIFSVDDGSKAGQQVFVNPYTGKVLRAEKPGSGVVGLANRLHGYLNVNTWKLSLPTVSAIWDGGKIMRAYVVSDMVRELFGGRTLVLVLSNSVVG